MANRGLMAECKELLRTLPDLERLLKKYEINLGASWVSRTCPTHVWRKTKKRKRSLNNNQTAQANETKRNYYRFLHRDKP